MDYIRRYSSDAKLACTRPCQFRGLVMVNGLLLHGRTARNFAARRRNAFRRKRALFLRSLHSGCDSSFRWGSWRLGSLRECV